MNDDSQDSFSPPKRKLSRFLARKMLYDFVCDRLDSRRRQAVEEFIAEDWETGRELEYIREALKYCDELGHTKISEPLMQEIREHKGFWGQAKERLWWKDWPESVKWGMEAVILSAVAAMVAIWIPWNKVTQLLPRPDSQVVLVELEKSSKLPDAIETEKKSLSDQGEGRVLSSLTSEGGAKKNEPSPSVTTEAKEEKPVVQTNKAEPVVATATAIPPSRQKSAEDEEVDDPGTIGGESEGHSSHSAPTTSPLKGFIYRAFMNLDKLDQVTPQIVAEIKRLGGAKAGEVELGWRKPNGSYFHFSIPESNYDSLMKVLQNLGPVRIYKDPHRRVMPHGQIRFILWVEDNQVKK